MAGLHCLMQSNSDSFRYMYGLTTYAYVTKVLMEYVLYCLLDSLFCYHLLGLVLFLNDAPLNCVFIVLLSITGHYLTSLLCLRFSVTLMAFLTQYPVLLHS